MSAPTPPATMRGLVSVVSRRWRVFASCLALTLVGFTLLGASLPHRFESTAIVRVEPTGQVAPTVKVADQLNMPTEVRAATSEAVVGGAAKAAGSTWTPTTLAASTRVVSPQDSQLLEITVGSTDAAQAALGANQIATAYLGQRAVTAGAAVAAERAQLDARINGLKQRIKKLDAPAGVDISAGDSAQITALAGQVDQLESDLTELDLHAGPNGVLLDSADVAQRSSTPALPIFLVAGVALGCAVGAAAAAWCDRRDSSVQDGHRMSQILNVPVVEADGDRPCDDLAAELVRQLAAHSPRVTGRTMAVVGDYADVVADAVAVELDARGSTVTVDEVGEHQTSARPTAPGGDGWNVRASTAPLLHGTTLQLAQESAVVVVVTCRSHQTSSLIRFEELLTLRGGGIDAAVLLPDVASSGEERPGAPTSSAPRPTLRGALS